jgi:hypothetical protein
LPCIFLGAHTRYRLAWLPVTATAAAAAVTHRSALREGLRVWWRMALLVVIVIGVTWDLVTEPPW